MKIAEFIEASNCAPDNQGLFKAMEFFSASVGYDRIAYGVLNGYENEKRKNLPGPAVLLNYSPEWVGHYVDQDYDKIDPVIQLTPEMSAPFKWNDLTDQYKITDAQELLLAEAQDGGMHNGISVPIHGPFGKVAVVSFAASSSMDEGNPSKDVLPVIAVQFHTAFEAMRNQSLKRTEIPQFSPRQVDCISWVGRGKSSWDISMILGISHNTVNYHIKDAMRKLETSSRTVCVVKAIRLGIIKL